MKTSLKGLWLVAAAIVVANPAHATNLTWDGSGDPTGNGSSIWTSTANYSPAGPFSSSNTLDYGTITTNTTLTSSGPATISVAGLDFGDASSPYPAPNITLSGDGTAGDVVVSLASGGSIILGSPSNTTQRVGPVDTLDSDVTLALGTFTATDTFGTYVRNNSITTTVTTPGTSVLLLSAQVTGTAGSGGSIVLGLPAFYSDASNPPNSNPAVKPPVAVALTNNNSTFDAPISIAGAVSYTSIGNVGGGASALGDPSTAANGTITTGAQTFAYIGSGNQTTNRALVVSPGGTNTSQLIANYASSPSVLTFNGTLTNSTGTYLQAAASSGNTVVINSTIGNDTGGGAVQFYEPTSSTFYTYANASGVLQSATNNNGTVVLGGNNSYTGSTNVQVGTLVLSGDSTISGGVNVSNGATLDINAGGTSTTNSAIGTGALTVTSGAKIDNTSTGSLTVATNNAITLGTSFTYGGTQNLNLGTGAVSYAAAATGTATLGGTNSTLTFGGVVSSSNTSSAEMLTVNGAGNTLVFGSYAMNKNGTQYTNVVNGTGNFTVTSGITSPGNAADGLTYSGSGTMTVGGSSSYTGQTTVSSGAFFVTNSNPSTTSATGTGSLTVNQGATFGGTGSSRSTATLAAFNIGTSGSGVATVYVGQVSASDHNTTGSLTLTGAGTGAASSTIENANLVFNLASTAVAHTTGNSNVLNLGGTALSSSTFTNMTLTLNPQGGIATDTAYLLIEDTSGFSGTDIFTTTNSLGQNVITSGGLTIAGTYFGSSTGGYSNGYYHGSYLFVTDGGTEIDVEVVPEPASWAMMLGGLAALFFWQRRRGNNR